MGQQGTSKRIWLEHETIYYQVTSGAGWSLPISELELLGEYTDPNGPYVDDYFLVFVTRPEHSWYEASFYAEGLDELLKHLGQALGFEPPYGLVNSTDYNSDVIWPPEVKGQTLFKFVPVESPGLLARIRHKLIPEYYFVFTDSVKAHLAGS